MLRKYESTQAHFGTVLPLGSRFSQFYPEILEVRVILIASCDFLRYDPTDYICDNSQIILFVCDIFVSVKH
jgi:hypothetical protein